MPPATSVIFASLILNNTCVKKAGVTTAGFGNAGNSPLDEPDIIISSLVVGVPALVVAVPPL